MKNNKILYWTVADGDHGYMAETMIDSARKVGVEEDFHVISDRIIKGATSNFDSKNFDKSHYLFKFHFLKDHVGRMLDYDYFIFIDADCYFVRHPGNVLDCMQGAPIHVCMESDCTNLNSLRKDWWDCPLPIYVELMRQRGVKSNAVYNTNAGFWIVKRQAVDHFYNLTMAFWNYCNSKTYAFTEEAPLAYVGHMMMGDCELHTLKTTTDLWASDWMGVFKDRLPEDVEWQFTDYMTMVEYPVKPAIVHAMRSKQVMIDLAKAKNDSSNQAN